MDNRKKRWLTASTLKHKGLLLTVLIKFLIHWLEGCMVGNWTKTCRSSNTGRLVEKWDVRRNEEVRRTHRKMEWVPMNLLNRIHWNSNMMVGVEDSSLHTDAWQSQLAYSDGRQPLVTVLHSTDQQGEFSSRQHCKHCQLSIIIIMSIIISRSSHQAYSVQLTHTTAEEALWCICWIID